MNRKERRGAAKRAQGGGVSGEGLPPAAMFAQAVRQHQLGDLLSAEAICRSILSQDVNDAGSLHLLGIIAQQSRRFDEAVACFRRLVGVRPDFAPAHHALGGALAAAGRFEEAIPAFEKAVTLTPAGAAPPMPDVADLLLALGNLYGRIGRADEAAQRFNRVLALRPDHAQAHNDFGAMLLAQGKPREASQQFVRALELAPEVLENSAAVLSMLVTLNPVLGEGIRRAETAWPALVPASELLGPAGLGAIAGDALLRCVLQSTPVREIALERFLTSARAALLGIAANSAGDVDNELLALACALARQCFINEYVFAETPDETQRVEALRRSMAEALEKSQTVPPLWCAAVASYGSLSSSPDGERLLARSWPEPVEKLLNQQVREVQQERELRDSIPRLTGIEEGASVLVRQHYEENPYPRWVLPPSARSPLYRQAVTVDQHLQSLFPSTPFRPLGDHGSLDIMIAGCGTGEHPIGMARMFKSAQVLALDLSLSSLCYAVRKTRELGLQNIEYGQADILRLGSLGRSFDVVDAGGVLHHMADPAEGWRQLLALVRPGGFMRIGLYSELGRADIVAARRFIAERGYQPTAEDIRRCRQDILATPLKTITRFRDFFGTSECRDLLFHVQEHRLSIPKIAQFVADQGLHFIGFEVGAETANAYRARFPDDRSMTNLDHWHAFETARPETFMAMYKFWCQR